MHYSDIVFVSSLQVCPYSDINCLFIFNPVPAYYALILRSLTVLEGLALYADPNFKVLAASYPYFAKRLLTDPNPYLRDALIELLFKDGKFRQEHALLNIRCKIVLRMLTGVKSFQKLMLDFSSMQVE